MKNYPACKELNFYQDSDSVSEQAHEVLVFIALSINEGSGKCVQMHGFKIIFVGALKAKLCG